MRRARAQPTVEGQPDENLVCLRYEIWFGMEEPNSDKSYVSRRGTKHVNLRPKKGDIHILFTM
jgi:hypothetical protein